MNNGRTPADTSFPLLADLVDEIRAGTLLLRADRTVRFRFSFSIESHPVGLYAVRSDGPGKLSLLRRWNQERDVYDPVNGLTVQNRGRQFGLLQPGLPMFLVEYTSDLTIVVGKAAFKAGKVRVCDADLPGAPEEMKFEAAFLWELEFFG
jgi:hypothetical protein